MPSPSFSIDAERDRRFMAAALSLAQGHLGLTWPNPSVGAVIVSERRGFPEVVGRGVTGMGGQPHAEIAALAAAGEAARGATIYVTLEPCAHHGVSPPCTRALAAAGIARVVGGADDPDPRVSGQGYTQLMREGIAVTPRVLAKEAERVSRGHALRMTAHRPLLRLKLAVTADGMIGLRNGGQIPISGALARAYGHGLRAASDAIMVGIGTVLSDDPALTCRLPGLESRSPLRIVLDKSARLPLTAKLVRSARHVPTFLFVGPDAPEERIERLADLGVRLVKIHYAASGHLDLKNVLEHLARFGITSVLVEGGATLASTLIRANLLDEVHLITSPLTLESVTFGLNRLIHPFLCLIARSDPKSHATFRERALGEKTKAIPALTGLPLDVLTDPAHFTLVSRRKLGDDMLFHRERRF